MSGMDFKGTEVARGQFTEALDDIVMVFGFNFNYNGNTLG